MFTEKYHWPPWKKEEKNIMRLGWSHYKMFTEKYRWLPWKKDEKNIMRLGWSRYKFAIATTFPEKHQARFKLSYTNQVYLLNWKILNLFAPVFLRLMEYLRGSDWQRLRSWNFSWICASLWTNVSLKKWKCCPKLMTSSFLTKF